MQNPDRAFTPAIRVSRVLGARVLDESGHRLGTISDVMLDRDSNSILGVIVSRHALWGLSEAYQQLPWSALQYDLFDRSYKLPGSIKDWSEGWRASPDAGV